MKVVGCLFCLVFAALAQESIQTGRAFYRGGVVQFEVHNGRAIIEGDIDLGPPGELPTAWQAPAAPIKGPVRESLAIASAQALWPNGVVPYVVDPSIPNPSYISTAMASWTAATSITFVPRTSQSNYVYFQRLQNNGTCTSSVGMIGGRQFLNVDDACTAGILTHEIGHTLGLYHEHSRSDRDYYVTIDYTQVDPRRVSDMNYQLPIANDVGAYDYGSIMHYGRYDAAVDRFPDMTTIPPGVSIPGASVTLSPGDIDAIRRYYGAPSQGITIATNPLGLQVIVDGVETNTPATFQWPVGSTHTLDVDQYQNDGAITRYSFGRWGDSAPKSRTITVTSDLSVYSAHFVTQYRFTSGVTPSRSGTVTVAPFTIDGYFDDGTAMTVTATPASGYVFAGWTGRMSTLGDPIGNATNNFILNFSAPNYTARFVSAPGSTGLITVATDPPGLPVTAAGAKLPGPWIVQGASTTVSADATVAFGYQGNRYVFQGWSDGGAATHTVSLPSSGQNVTVTARYKLQHVVATKFSGNGSISVSPTSVDGYYDDGTQVQVTASPASGYQLAGWGGTLSGTSPSQSVTVSAPVLANAGFLQPFTLAATNIVNAANYVFTPVSPGEIVTIFGLNIGAPLLTTLQVGSDGKVVNALAGSRVLFDGVAAPLVYSSPNQISAVVPYGVAGKSSTNVQLSLNGATSNTVSLPVGTASPGLFTLNSAGNGQGAILNQDYTVNSPSNPALKGSTVILYATGEGQTSPAGVDGSVAGKTLPAPVQSVSVRIGGPVGVGKQAQVSYAGAAPGFVAGVLQMNVVIPTDAPSGSVPISVSVGSASSFATASVSIQ